MYNSNSTDETIERLAESIHETFPAVLIQDGADYVAPPWNELAPGLQELTREAARAAFDVMNGGGKK